MAKEHKVKHSRHPLRKRILRGLMFTLLALLFLEFLVYFGSNLFLRNWVGRKLNEATKDVYNVEFNRVYFSLIRRGVFMDGIIMKPVSPHEDNQRKALFDLSVDEVALRNLWFNFSEGVLYIGRVTFDNPNIHLDLPETKKKDTSSLPQIDQESPVKVLEEEIKKSIRGINFAGVFIEELEIDHADLFFLNFLSDHSLKAENTRLLVKEINWTTKEEWSTPFNAKGFEFDLDNVNFPLPDGIHFIQADKVLVNSLENTIDISGFYLSSDKSADSRAYYDVTLKELRVGNVALNDAFMTSNVRIDEIILNEPQIKVEQRLTSQKDSTATGDLNELIEGILKSFEVKELSVNNGKFTTFNVMDSLKNRIDINQLDFKMVSFYLGDDEAKKGNQFFYGDDASMEIQNADLYLSDDLHVIYGDRVSVSSFKDEIIIENVRVAPREEALTKMQPENIIRISLPKLALSNTNLKRLYNEGIFDIEEMLVESPQVEITELNAAYPGDQDTRVPVQELMEGYMSEILIGKMDLRDGVVQFKNEKGIRSDDIGFEKFSLLLEKVRLQPDADSDVRNQILAEDMVLSLDKYRLKLRDNLHEFMADKILIDSKNSLVVINDFTLRPENPQSIQKSLDTYNKSVVLNVTIPEFRVEGIDLMAAYTDEKLIINRILVPSPIADFTRFRKKTTGRSSTTQVESSDEFAELLTSYFSVIQIDSVSFSDGQVKYNNFAGKRKVTLSEDSLSLNLKGFSLVEGQSKIKGRTFFSDEIELILRKYDFSVAGGNYEVDTDVFRFNSREKTIKIDNLKVHPSTSISSKLELSLNLPTVTFQGVDIEAFLFENELELDKLVVDGSTINLDINKNYKVKPKVAKSQAITKSLPKSIEKVFINTIEANNSKLRINYNIGTNNYESIHTDFDLNVSGLNLDSATNAHKDIAGLFEEVNLTLKDFSYALPDSIHTIRFSAVNVDNTAEETVFLNFEVIPKSTKGNAGKPVFSAKIDELGVKNNAIREIQRTGVFNLAQLRLANPEINVYLDSGNLVGKNTKDKKEMSAEVALVNSILLQDIVLNNGNIYLHNKETGLIPKMSFRNLNFGLQGLNFDLLKKNNSFDPELVLENDLSLSLSNYHLYSKDSLTRFEIGKVSYRDNTIIVDNVTYGPTIGRYEYLRKLGYQTDAITATIAKIQLQEIDFEEYFNNKRIKAEKLEINGLSMDVFRDKRLPVREGVIKPMPQQLMQHSPIDLDIDSVIVQDGIIRYQEFSPKAMLPGSVRFEDLNASIAPFAVRKSGEKYPFSSATLTADTKIMGEGEVKLSAEMFFEEPYPMDMEVEMGEFDLRLLNDLISNGSFIRVINGKVTDGKWDFRINDDEAIGKMDFKYKGLKLEFLDSLTLDRGKGKLGLFTFVANLVTKNSNPRKFFNNRVTSTVYTKRDKSKFIFGSWWRATFSGLKGSIGLGQPKAPKKEEEE